VPVGEPLVTFLEACPDARVTLPFEEVERILGQPLPASARKYSSWWRNPRYWHVRHLRELGWRVSCSMAAERVTFTKNRAG
jgi:hypothetical protein